MRNTIKIGFLISGIFSIPFLVFIPLFEHFLHEENITNILTHFIKHTAFEFLSMLSFTLFVVSLGFAIFFLCAGVPWYDLHDIDDDYLLEIYHGRRHFPWKKRRQLKKKLLNLWYQYKNIRGNATEEENLQNIKEIHSVFSPFMDEISQIREFQEARKKEKKEQKEQKKKQDLQLSLQKEKAQQQTMLQFPVTYDPKSLPPEIQVEIDYIRKNAKELLDQYSLELQDLHSIRVLLNKSLPDLARRYAKMSETDKEQKIKDMLEILGRLKEKMEQKIQREKEFQQKTNVREFEIGRDIVEKLHL